MNKVNYSNIHRKWLELRDNIQHVANNTGTTQAIYIMSNGDLQLREYNPYSRDLLVLIAIPDNNNGTISIREKLSEYAHSSWSGWMEYLFSKCKIDSNDNAIIPKLFVKRWIRQMKTNYLHLSEHEKESERLEADRILNIISKK